MIKLTIDNQEIEITPGATILVAAKSAGITIPTLCYLEACGATGSCMVCGVKNLADGKMIPACAARCEAGMKIVTSSPEVIAFRRGVIELLLNEHRGDCLAPCQLACPQGLDISSMLHLIVQGKNETAAELLLQAIPDPQKTCTDCRARCELACRRGRHDTPIAIRQIIMDLVSIKPETATPLGPQAPRLQSTPGTAGAPPAFISSSASPAFISSSVSPASNYNHRFGLVTETDMEIFIETKNSDDSISEAARCLRCDCRSTNDCQLRQLAAEYDAKQQRFGKSSIKFKRIYFGEVGYEVGKCVKCGNCIAVGESLKPGFGPVFSDRGEALTVAAPFGVEKDNLFKGIASECLKVCPTGALFLQEDQ
jgi:predicted molibdopterin-dependent oxidoreductase YjgC